MKKPFEKKWALTMIIVVTKFFVTVWTTYLEEDSDNPCPKFVLFLDSQKEAIVLAIRGTSSETDVIIDLMCDDMDFLDGYAHKGTYL